MTSVLLTPDSIELSPGSQQQFTALAEYSDGTSASIRVNWGATGGTIDSVGLYAAGSGVGTFQVIGADPVSGKAAASVVTISQAPPPIQYETLAAQNWSTYADKGALSGLFGVEGHLNTLAPALPVTDFYDLVSDPLFGKVVRYNGGPQLNTTDPSLPGRTAIYQIALGKSAPPNPGWWTPTSGIGAGTLFFPTHLWVRQFIRFSPAWTTTSSIGGQGGPDYKALFLRYFNSSSRHEVKIGDQARGMMHSGGNPSVTKVSDGTLPWNNTVSMNVQYNTSGWGGVDFYPLVLAPGPYPSTPSPSAPYGPGNGEWVEMVIHHKTVAERGEFTVYWRQYTVGGVVSPQAWKIDARYLVGQPGQVWWGVSNYQMGVNRNRQYDTPMYIFWGPYEVVDGGVYPNPWNLPGN